MANDAVFTAEQLEKGGQTPLVDLAHTGVQCIGAGDPWKNEAPTVLIQTDAGLQRRIGAKSLYEAMVASTSDLSNCVVGTPETGLKFPHGIRFEIESKAFRAHCFAAGTLDSSDATPDGIEDDMDELSGKDFKEKYGMTVAKAKKEYDL